jgi:hypothetical protein
MYMSTRRDETRRQKQDKNKTRQDKTKESCDLQPTLPSETRQDTHMFGTMLVRCSATDKKHLQKQCASSDVETDSIL